MVVPWELIGARCWPNVGWGGTSKDHTLMTDDGEVPSLGTGKGLILLQSMPKKTEEISIRKGG